MLDPNKAKKFKKTKFQITHSEQHWRLRHMKFKTNTSDEVQFRINVFG